MSDDIWKEPPTNFCRDEIRYGTAEQMIDEIIRLRRIAAAAKEAVQTYEMKFKSNDMKLFCVGNELASLRSALQPTECGPQQPDAKG